MVRVRYNDCVRYELLHSGMVKKKAYKVEDIIRMTEYVDFAFSDLVWLYED